MIIGLTGKAGAGKTTAASFLVRDLGFTCVKFAALLKGMLYTLGLSYAHIEGELKEVPCAFLCGKTPRYAMQTLGTEWGRNMLGDDVWVRVAMQRVRLYPNVVFDDMRYPNEAAAIKARQGVIWTIERPSIALVEAHASEAAHATIQPDAILTNNGTLDQLREAVHTLHYSLEEERAFRKGE